MKREGRQRGMVRTYRITPSHWNPRPKSTYYFNNRLDSPPTAGFFTKVAPKPTNHSKFTGKCDRPRCSDCHLHPSSKSKSKSKGTQKLRSYDGFSDNRLIAWRVVDTKPGLSFSGSSATGMLEHLSSTYHHTDALYDYHGPDDDDDDDDECYKYDGDDVADSDDDDDDEKLGFCVIELGQVDEDEGWCVIGEL